MSKAALTLTEDAKAMIHVRNFSNTLWETKKKQKTQATNPPTAPTPLWNRSQLTEDDNEEKYKFKGKMYSGNALLGLWEAECDQALKETPLSLYTWKMHNPQDRAKFVWRILLRCP
eukprot:190510-Prymnesium_polylepis.1